MTVIDSTKTKPQEVSAFLDRVLRRAGSLAQPGDKPSFLPAVSPPDFGEIDRIRAMTPPGQPDSVGMLRSIRDE